MIHTNALLSARLRLLSLFIMICLLAATLAPASTPPAAAEGSKQLAANSGNRAFTEYRTADSGGVQRETIIYVYAEEGEVIHLGSSVMNAAFVGTQAKIGYTAPNDTDAQLSDGNDDPTDDDPTLRTFTGEFLPNNADGCGHIGSLAQENAGPLPNAGGYDACTITVGAGQSGIWRIDFFSPDPTSAANPNPILATNGGAWPQPNNVGYLTAWDITVRDAGGTEIPGRAYANYLALNMGNNGQSLASEVFIKTNDGALYNLDLNGIDPFGFIFFANNKGFLDDAGNAIYRSLQFTGYNPGSLPPGYDLHQPNQLDNGTDDVTHKIFFNPPADDLPTEAPIAGSEKPTWLNPAFEDPTPPSDFTFTGLEDTAGQAGSSPLGGYFSFVDNGHASSYSLFVDLNDNGVADGVDPVLLGSASAGTNKVYWNGRDANGDPVPPTTTLGYQAFISFQAGEAHFPFIDPENNPDGLQIKRITPTLPAQGETEGGDEDSRYIVYYDDSYNYTGTGLDDYDYSLCEEGGANPAPAGSNVIDEDGDGIPDPGCYGTPPAPRSALNGVDSRGGAHEWNDDFGNKRGMDTWVYVPYPPIELAGRINIAEADLQIDKTDTLTPATNGDPITYEVTVTNNGPSDVQNARVIENIPASITGVTWTCAPVANCDDDSGTGNSIDTTVDLANGEQATFTIEGTASDVSDPIVNTATVERPPDVRDPDTRNNTAVHTITSDPPSPAIGVAKQNRSVVSLGKNSFRVTYEINVVNLGQTQLDNVQVSEDLSASFAGAKRFTVDSISTGDTSLLTVNPDFDGDTDTDMLAGSDSLDIGQSGIIYLVITLEQDASSPNNYENQVRATAAGGVTDLSDNGIDPDPNGNGDPGDPGEDTPTPLELPVADLSLTKSIDSSTVILGENAVFTIEVTNDGPDDATSVEVRDLLPIGMSYQSHNASQGSYTEASGIWAIGTIPADSSVTLEITARAAVVGSGENQAQVFTSDQYDPDSTPGNNVPDEDDQQSVPFTIVTVPALDSTKADALVIDTNNDGIAGPGDTLEYTITIANTGNATAADVVLTDPIDDANLSLVVGSVTTSQGSVTTGNTAGDTTVAVDVGSLAVDDEATITFRVRIADPLPAGVTQVANQGSITGSNFPTLPTDDPNTTTDDDPTVTPLTAAPALDSTKADALVVDDAGDGIAGPGDTLEYTITIANTGNTSAEDVVLTDPIDDANLSLVVGSVTTSQGSVTTGNTAGDTTVAVNVGSLAANDTATITFRVRIADPLPAGVTQVANQGSITGSNFPTLPTDDPDTTTDDDPTVTPVNAVPELDSTKADMLAVDADNNSMPSAGDTLEYTIIIANTGSGTAQNVTFTDPIRDANLSLVVGSVTTSQGSVTTGNTAGDTTVAVDVGSLPVDEEVTITFRVLIADPLAEGVTRVANQGRITGSNFPTLPTDDPDTIADDDPTVTPLTRVPALAATKADSLAIDTNSDGRASPGDTLEYTIIIANTGNAAAENVQFNDVVNDPNLTLVSGSVTTSQGSITSGNTAGDTAVVVAVGTIAADDEVTITFRVLIADPLPADVTRVINQGTVNADNTPSIPTDDPSTPPVGDPTITPVSAEPDLDSFKADFVVDENSDGMNGPGDTIEYVITLMNNGNGTATDVEFTDTPDANTTLNVGSVTTSQGSVTSGNTAGDSSIAVTVGSVPAGGKVTITFKVTIVDPLPADVDRILNQGFFTGDNVPRIPTDDPETLADDDPNMVPVAASPALYAVKQDILLEDNDGDGVSSAGDTLNYIVQLSNRGNAAALNTTFSDQLDPNTSLVPGSLRVSNQLGSNLADDGSILVNLGTIPAGGSVEISYQATINAPLPEGVVTIENQGFFNASNIPDPIPTDAPDTVVLDDSTVTVVAPPPVGALALSKHVERSDDTPFAVGDTVNFTIRITNTGETTIVLLPLVDTYETTYLEFASATPAPDQTTPGSITWDDLTEESGDLAPGDSISIRVAFTALEATEETVNVAAIQNAVDDEGTRLNNEANALADITIPTSVRLSSFTARTSAEGTLVRWSTSLEIDSWGFHLWRSSDGRRASAQRVTPELILARGGNTGASYSWLDPTALPGTIYTYWLEEIELNGTSNEYGPATTARTSTRADNPVFLPLIIQPQR